MAKVLRALAWRGSETLAVHFVKSSGVIILYYVFFPLTFSYPAEGRVQLLLFAAIFLAIS